MAESVCRGWQSELKLNTIVIGTDDPSFNPEVPLPIYRKQAFVTQNKNQREIEWCRQNKQLQYEKILCVDAKRERDEGGGCKMAVPRKPLPRRLWWDSYIVAM